MMDWNQLLQPEIVWTVIGLMLLISEFAVPGLVVGFFGLGAILVGVFCTSIDLSLNAQICVFMGSSLTMLLTLRQWSAQFLQKFRPDAQTHDLDDVIGARAEVVRPISPDDQGRVEVHGTDWRATANEVIPTGTSVIVVGRSNLTLLVKPDSATHAQGQTPCKSIR